MSNISNFFNSLATGNKWKAGVAFTRTGALPLDDSSVFASVTAAQEYAATGGNSYPGQFITVVTESEVIAFVVTPAKTIQRLASTSIEGDVDSAISKLNNDLTTLTGTVNGLSTTVGNHATDLAKKEYKLTDSNTVTFDRTNAEAPVANVKVSSKDGNSLSIDEDNGGLYVEVPEVDVPEYTVAVSAVTTEGYAKSYELQKDGVAIGAKIDIPKDMVVQSGSVQTYTTETLPDDLTTPGTYIVLTLSNAANDTIYIPADSLIEYVTSGSDTDDAVQITIGSDYKVTAAIKDGSIVTSMLAAAVVTTEKINDKAVTKNKLSETLQDSIDKADSAVQPDDIKSDLDAAADTDLVNAGAIKTAIANKEVPEYGAITDTATNDTWAGSKDVYDLLTITHIG